MSALQLWRRALCLALGHRPFSQRGLLLRSSHVRCLRCGEFVRAPMEPAA